MLEQDLQAKIHAMMPDARSELAELVRFRSVADPRQFPASGCKAAASWVRDAFEEAGVGGVELLGTSDGSFAVVGHQPGPPGTPTVLLYSHYDVQPPGDESLWASDPFILTERDGRWYGRGAADCKGNVVMHSLALRALGSPLPVGITVVSEGSEEMGGAGLDTLVETHPELFAADVILIADTGNSAVGVPVLTTSLRGTANVVMHVETLSGAVHSGMYGGPAPDALAALIQVLSTLRDAAGNTVVDGLECSGSWDGIDYAAEQFRVDAGVLDGVELAGTGSVADRLWARPALTVLGIDCPPVVGSAAAITPRASARLNLRVPPGLSAEAAQDALVAHLEAHIPWNAKLTIEREATGSPFRSATGGAGFGKLRDALSAAYGKPVGEAGQGGSIPLCNVLGQHFPDAEIALFGVEEPQCRIHAANESVDPSEIEKIALAEAIFLRSLASD